MPSIINATTTAGVAVTGDNSGALALQTNNGTTAVTIDTSQNVGIGETSPAGSAGYTQLVVRGSSGAELSLKGGTTQYGYVYVDNGGFRIINPQSGSSSGTLQFSTSNTERVRITSGGDVCIGTTSANGKLTINQTDTGARTITASSPSSYAATAFRSDSAATAGTGWYHLYGSSSGGSVNNIFIYGNGNIQNANNSYGAISDIKLKENIVDATPKLDKLMQVKVRNYNLKGEYEQHKQIGVIAQELEHIFPSLIEETQDRGENDEVLGTTTKSVKYSVFVPMLIKAVQELNAKVEAQAVRIAELEGAK